MDLMNNKSKPTKFHSVQTLENARKVNEELFNAYNAVAVECYEKRDFDSYNYWLDRAYSMIREKHQLEKDISKLKGENYGVSKKM